MSGSGDDTAAPPLWGLSPDSEDDLDSKPVVLVVDDEPELVRLSCRILRAAGMEVLPAHNGAEALAVLDSQRVDAIVSDVSMPGMNGVELVRAIRKRDLDVPVIIMTGGATVESAIEAIENGVFRYLLKPVMPDALVDATTRAVQLRRLARAKDATLRTLGAAKGLQADRMGLEAALDSAIDSLWPAFQPILSSDSGELFGYEALLRTDEPSLPNPGAVLDAAERLSQLTRLFRTMRERTCKLFAAAGTPWTLFLNLHPKDLVDPSLLDPNSLVYRCAGNIVLEVTERSALDRITDLRRRIALLRGAGYRIAIDDLGAGYAGLNSFAALEPEFVKFDMALVRNIHQSDVKQRLMRVMSGLCHDMGIKLVAEGIETNEERDAVIDLGCDLLQGFRFGRPDRTPTLPTW
jgi:EAL domain-containing protein (putative c-di-GMP-specific phosphodiesterase class I)